MGDHLKVNTADLLEAGAALRHVRDELDHAQDRVGDAQGIVGHSLLARRLGEFVSNWDDHRKEMLGGIGALGEAAEQAGKTYEQVDRDLANALRDGGA